MFVGASTFPLRPPRRPLSSNQGTQKAAPSSRLNAKADPSNAPPRHSDGVPLSLAASKNAALTTTNTEPKLCHSAPVTGVSTPEAERAMAVKLMSIETTMFTLMRVRHRRHRANR